VCRGVPCTPYSLPPHTPFRPRPYSPPPQPPIRPMLPSAPGSLPPQAPFRPILPPAPASRQPQSDRVLVPCHSAWSPSAPYSRPPQPPVRPSLPGVRPILPSAPWHAPFRPTGILSSAPYSLGTAPYSAPPHAPFRPRLPLRRGRCLPCVTEAACMRAAACAGCQRILTGRSQVWRCGACQLAYIDARCMRSCASAPRLICQTPLRWSAPSIAPTANDLRPELELTRFQVDRGSYATSSAPP
jgi:hypothetical protein